MKYLNQIRPRPITPLEDFEKAFEIAELTKSEKELIDYIRYVGTFNQVILTSSLRLKSKPKIYLQDVLTKTEKKHLENLQIHLLLLC